MAIRAVLSFVCAVLFAVTAAAQDPDYLREMPNPDFVKTQVRGTNLMNTAAAQAATLVKQGDKALETYRTLLSLDTEMARELFAQIQQNRPNAPTPPRR